MPHWMKSWRWLAVVALSVAAVLAFSACGDDDEEDGGATTPAGTATAAPDGGGENVVTVKAGDKIQVGVMAVLSGDNVALGTTVLKAAELAAQQLGDVEGL